MEYIPPGPGSTTPAQQLVALQTAERRWAYVLLRLVLGVNFFGHGFIRIYHGSAAFAEWMVAHMSLTPFPAGFLRAFGYTVPWIELLFGILLILGLFTRATLRAAMLFLAVLMVGVTMRQDWTTAGVQLVYALVILVLLFLREPYDAGWTELLRQNRNA